MPQTERHCIDLPVDMIMLLTILLCTTTKPYITEQRASFSLSCHKIFHLILTTIGLFFLMSDLPLLERSNGDMRGNVKCFKVSQQSPKADAPFLYIFEVLYCWLKPSILGSEIDMLQINCRLL